MKQNKQSISSYHKKYKNGFTIVELLIATAVFSLVLLIFTFAIVEITRIYSRGVTDANTQNAARNIINDVGQDIQFSGTTPITSLTPFTKTVGVSKTVTIYGVCIGNQLFEYQLGSEIVGDSGTPNYTLTPIQQYHGLVVIPSPGCSASTPLEDIDVQNPAGATELLSTNMRLAVFNITPVANTNLWKIDVRVIYGDNDLVSAQGLTSAATCLGTTGSQFCAVSELASIVEQRVQ